MANALRERTNNNDACLIEEEIFIFFPQNVTPIYPNLNEFRKLVAVDM